MWPTILRSLVIALVVAGLASFVSDLLFAEIAVPLPSYDQARAASMSQDEAAAYLTANMKRISGLEFVVYSLKKPRWMALRAKTAAVYFGAVFLGCLILALWTARAGGLTTR
jgi:hypothetical protein